MVEPADSASVHGVVTYISPVKKSQKGSNYFNATLSDGTTTCRVVGFKESQQERLKEAMEKQETIGFGDCQVKKAKRGFDAMEVLLKRTTSIGPSPKKFKVDRTRDEEKVIPLEEVKVLEEFEKVAVRTKVLKVSAPTTVSTGKRVQDVILGDSTGSMRCTLWEEDIGQLEEGKSYHLQRFTVREFQSKKYISKGQESMMCGIEDIGETAIFEDVDTQLTTVKEAQIVAVQQLDKYRSCLVCKARVEPLESGFGRCSKHECQMLQKYNVCPEHLYAKLMFLSTWVKFRLFVCLWENTLGPCWYKRQQSD